MDDSPSSTRTRDERAVRTLVLWSGGIDSTYTLWRLLAGGEQVVTLHVSIHGSDDEKATNRARFERAATQRLAQAMSVLADVDAGLAPMHLESSATHPGASHRHARASILMFHAALAMAALAFTPRDRLALGVNGDVDPHWWPTSAGFALRRLLILRQLRAGMEREDVPRLALWEPRPAKASMLAALPAALARSVVSCTQPAPTDDGGLIACGHCDKCRWRQRAQESAARASGSAPEHDVERTGAAVVTRR